MGSTGPRRFELSRKRARRRVFEHLLRASAGAIFNLANLLLVAGIDLVGLATAFPVAIGIALVVGTVVSYILQPVGNLRMIIAGLLCAVVAVVLDGLAYAQMASNKTIERKGTSCALCRAC